MYRFGDKSLHDLTPTQLVESRIPNQQVTCIWVGFSSEHERHYEAVFVFEPHSAIRSTPYILLSSKDGDAPDLIQVAKILAKDLRCRLEGRVTNRPGDICTTIEIRNIPDNRQLWLATKCITLFAKHFFKVKIISAYYNTALPDRLIGTCRAKETSPLSK
ncbi:MAG: hypothetical protein Q8Q39_03430 [bacterium]|nr:hypothetical protein [bacterium]